MIPAAITERENALARRLGEQYGELLALAEVALVLRLSSLDAARKARSQGRLPFPMFKVPHRRGWFAATADVARYLAQPLAREANRDLAKKEKPGD